MSFKSIYKVAGALSAAAALAFATAPAASASSSWTGYPLENKNAVCLGSQNGGQNTSAIVWGCNGHADQSWVLDWNGSSYRISNAMGDCLGIYGGSTGWGAHATVWGCNGHSDQQWYFQQGSDGWGGLVNVNSHLCLGTNGGVSSWGTSAIQWGCNGNPDQLWGH